MGQMICLGMLQMDGFGKVGSFLFLIGWLKKKIHHANRKYDAGNQTMKKEIRP